MTIAATLVRGARSDAGYTQKELARNSGIDQSAISRYEKGDHDPSTETFTRLLASAGTQLVPVFSRYPTIAAIATEIAERLTERFDHAYRSFLVANDSLRAETPLNRILLAVQRPELTGDARLDAALAGIVEYYLGWDQSPLPDWVNEPERFLPERWFVDDSAYGREHDPAQTPEPLLRRNVVLPAEGLENA